MLEVSFKGSLHFTPGYGTSWQSQSWMPCGFGPWKLPLFITGSPGNCHVSLVGLYLVALEDVQSWLMWQSQVGKSFGCLFNLTLAATSVKQPTCLSMDQAFAKCRTPTPTHEPWGLLVFPFRFRWLETMIPMDSQGLRSSASAGTNVSRRRRYLQGLVQIP